jgi:hypothetical protein
LSEGVTPEELDIRLDAGDLYREDVFTDRRVGTLRRLTPVTTGGDDDPGRPVLFMGQAQLWTQMGPLPISFEIPAATLAEAVEGFSAAAREAVQQTIEEAKEMRRQQASQIVVPGMGGPGPGGGLQLP